MGAKQQKRWRMVEHRFHWKICGAIITVFVEALVFLVYLMALVGRGVHATKIKGVRKSCHLDNQEPMRCIATVSTKDK